MKLTHLHFVRPLKYNESSRNAMCVPLRKVIDYCYSSDMSLGILRIFKNRVVNFTKNFTCVYTLHT